MLKAALKLHVLGWGRNDFSNNGAYQAIQKEVDVPLVDQTTCQNQMRTTRLGQNFQLDFTSFVCAGGEAGKGKHSDKLLCDAFLRFFFHQTLALATAEAP